MWELHNIDLRAMQAYQCSQFRPEEKLGEIPQLVSPSRPVKDIAGLYTSWLV